MLVLIYKNNLDHLLNENNSTSWILENRIREEYNDSSHKSS